MSDTNSPANAAPAPAGASVDQIREIIFGAQMQEYERRFHEFEERLQSEARSLGDELKNRFEDLERQIRDNVSRLEQSLANERRDREESARRLADKAWNDLAAARDEIHRAVDELTERKTDRAALSALLRDVAAHLENGQPAVPDQS